MAEWHKGPISMTVSHRDSWGDDVVFRHVGQNLPCLLEQKPERALSTYFAPDCNV